MQPQTGRLAKGCPLRVQSGHRTSTRSKIKRPPTEAAPIPSQTTPCSYEKNKCLAPDRPQNTSWTHSYGLRSAEHGVENEDQDREDHKRRQGVSDHLADPFR